MALDMTKRIELHNLVKLAISEDRDLEDIPAIREVLRGLVEYSHEGALLSRKDFVQCAGEVWDAVIEELHAD
jgi:hypothetical protein